MTILVAEDARGADLVRSKQVGELVLIHRLGKVGHVEVGVTLIGKCLELRVEGLAGEADFVSEIVEAADAVLGVLVVVILDEAEATGEMSAGMALRDETENLPLAQTSVEVNDRLGALDVTKARSPNLKKLIGGLREKATNVDVGLAALVLQSTIEGLER